MPEIADIRHQIEQTLHPAGFSKTGWEGIRRAALIPPRRHSCDLAQEQRLWVAASLRRATPQNQAITPRMVLSALTECDHDLSRLIPGFIPVAPGSGALPAIVLGRQLPHLIEQATGYCPDDNRLRAWCRKLGWIYSRNATCSGSQVNDLIQLWRSMRIAERQRSKTQARQNFHQHLAA
jgi:hypothetical protein